MYFIHFFSAVLLIAPAVISAQSGPSTCSRDYGDSYQRASDSKYSCVCGKGREKVDGDRYSCQFTQRSGVFAIFPSFSALFPTASTATKDASSSESDCRSQCLLDGNCQAYTFSGTEGSCTKGSQILPDKPTYHNPFNQASYKGRTTGISGMNCDDAVSSGRLDTSHKNTCTSGATFAALERSEMRGRILQEEHDISLTASECQDICVKTQDCLGVHFDSSAPQPSCVLFSQIREVVPSRKSKVFISGGCVYARSSNLISNTSCTDEQRLIPVDPRYQTPADLASSPSSSSSSTQSYTGPPPATVTDQSTRSNIGSPSTSQSAGPATVTSGGRPALNRRSHPFRNALHR